MLSSTDLRTDWRALGSAQDKKAEYVKKQDENEAKNPGGSAGGGSTRDKKNPTDAYGSSGIPGGEQGKSQTQVRATDALSATNRRAARGYPFQCSDRSVPTTLTTPEPAQNWTCTLTSGRVIWKM